ncbi:MAG: hypothetical protein CM15mP107_4460 [Bacteroidota bacterium]|nr:MAG: hypothetical protein CM15mP107_4460 [Bacteroidota bacterium]
MFLVLVHYLDLRILRAIYLSWSNLGSDQEYLNPQESSTYYLQVTDICGQQANDLLILKCKKYDPLIASSDTVYICEDIEDQICVDVVGGNEGV